MSEIHNYLLFMPSLMRNGCKDISYTVPGSDKQFIGKQTNIAATEYIIDLLNAREEKLDKILLLCSEEVLKNTVLPDSASEPITTIAYYEDVISRWAADQGYSAAEIQNLFAEYPLADINPGSCSSMDAIQLQMSRELSRSGQNKLYLDYTGGLRSASMLLLFFARLLEYSGAQVEQVLYSNISFGTQTGCIEDCIDTYRLFYRLDALTSTRYNDFVPLAAAAREIGDTCLAEDIHKTQAAVDSKKAGNYESAAQQAKSSLVRAEKDNLLGQTMAKVANKALEKLTMANIFLDTVEDKSLVNACQMAREKAPSMLIEKGLLQCAYWMTTKKPQVLQEQFDSYVYYYSSYLRFVQKMLKTLRQYEDREEFLQKYRDYMAEHTRLHPSSRNVGPVKNRYLIQEFDTFHPEIRQMLDADLKAVLDRPDSSREQILKAQKDHDTLLNSYMDTYLTAGFPFGNVDDGHSHTTYNVYAFHKHGKETTREVFRKSYSEEYLQKLDTSVNALLEAPMDQVLDRIDRMLQDKWMFQLAEVFPPVCSKDLFCPTDRNEAAFGPRLCLMNWIRKFRNNIIHAQKVSQADIDHTVELLNQLSQWLTSN